MLNWSLIWDNAVSVSAVAAAASAMAAVTALFITPLVAIFVAQKQIRASVISNNRQTWINALRDDLSELFEILQWQALLRPGTFSGSEGYKHVDSKRSRVRFLTNRIKLRLNPDEQDHQILLGKIEALAEEPADFDVQLSGAIRHAQTVLKREWIRVKRGR